MSDHWKSLADRLGAPGLSSSPKTDPTRSNQSNPPQHPTTPTKARTPAPETSPAPTSNPTAPIEESAKPKKRSSWEALASLFNIGGGASEVSAKENAQSPATEPESTEPESTEPESTKPTRELSLFKPSTTEQTSAALTEMFGETSSKPHESWGKPRRMVNDIDWEDDESVESEYLSKSNFSSEVRPTAPLDLDDGVDGDAETTDGKAETADEEPVRRSRRRRRRNRAGRSPDEARRQEVYDEDTGSSLLHSDESEQSGRDDRRDARREDSRRADDSRKRGDDSRRRDGRRSPSDDDRQREATKGRDEDPESRWGRLVGDDEDDDLDLIEVEPKSLEEFVDDDDAPAERRSRRRRRRGRGRGRSSSDPATSSNIVDEDINSANRDLPSANPDLDIDEDLLGADAEHDAGEPKGGEAGRRRRRKRGRGDKRNEGIRSESPDETLKSDSSGFDASLSSDEASDHKHRNIPTWEDSLVSIIEANIENHRRNESRGGGHRGGGGRPRGRR